MKYLIALPLLMWMSFVLLVAFTFGTFGYIVVGLNWICGIMDVIVETLRDLTEAIIERHL